MPTYEFRAPDGSIIERIFKISEVPESIELPDGQGVATRIISGGAGLLFKGSGFYITDYGKDGKKDQRAASGSESKSDSAPAAKTESKAESKPAPSSTPAPKAD
ncbi:MAG: zinc ribbon domain-containing protein [Gemmatimonadetes bacterium]|nr:zinc ribbon domain-containing protein [Gemmatimonadota bacterium]